MIGSVAWLLLFGLTARAAPPAPLDERASGDFVPDEPEAVIQTRLERAIERSVASMTWAFRPIARPRIRDTVRWCRGVHTEARDDAFAVRCDDEDEPFVVPYGAEGLTVPDDVGDPMDVSLSVHEDAVRLTVSSDKATQHTDYRFVGDDAMEMTVTIASRHFGVPLVYWARYRRNH